MGLFDALGAGLQIGGDDLDLGPTLQIRQAACVDVGSDHRMATVEKGAKVPAAATGKVQNRARPRHQRGEAQHPGRRPVGPVRPAMPRAACRFRFRNQDFNSMTYRRRE